MKPDFLKDLHANEVADDIIALLKLCQQLQSEKDGRERPEPGAYSRDEDEFAERVRTACGHALQLRRLIPMMKSLSAIGAGMERRGEITVITGESYADRALEHLMEEYLPEEGDAP
jgi:hypothetical protein